MNVNVADNTKRYKTLYDLGKVFGFKVPIDGLLSVVTHQVEIDIIALDKKFARSDPDYDDAGCTYKGIPISMSGYVRLKFGNEAHDKLEQLK